jgi:hypothetical protein
MPFFEPEYRGRPSVLGRPLLLAVLLAAIASACGSDPCTGEQCPGAAGTGATAATGSTPSGTARSGPCKTDARCDVTHGFACTAGECRHACDSHFDCEGQGLCQPLTDDAGQALGNFCSFSATAAPAGQYYTRCPNDDECDASAGFSCLGAGVGDADAYCSSSCGADTDCPTGFFCDQIQDSSGQDHPFCVRRRFCAPCDSDADCLSVPGQVCAHDPSGEKICTQICDPSADSCPWGNAAVCGMFDPERSESICAHRFGSCHGTGKSCEPCVRDSDCPRGICNGSSYTGERWCIDDAVTCNCDGLDTSQHICENGNGCPRTPGGLKMSCYDNVRYDGDPLGHACFTANTTGSSALASPQAGCWAPL